MPLIFPNLVNRVVPLSDGTEAVIYYVWWWPLLRSCITFAQRWLLVNLSEQQIARIANNVHRVHRR